MTQPSTIPIRPRPRFPRIFAYPAAALFAMLLMAGALALDMPVERAVKSANFPGVVDDLLHVAETFGNGFGVVLIVVVIAALDPAKRWLSVRIGGAALLCGLWADVVKLGIARIRPKAMDFDHAMVWDTFTGAGPFAAGGSAVQSFPSAHTATAAGLAVGLAYMYPRGRGLFISLALGVAVQRTMVTAHYPSDVLIGGALGASYGLLALPTGPVGIQWDRLVDWAWNRRQTHAEQSPVTIDVESARTDRRAA